MALPALTVSEHVLEAVIERLADGISSRLEQPVDQWMTVRRAAEYLTLSDNSIRALIKRDRIPFHRAPNGRVLLKRKEIDGWVRGMERIELDEDRLMDLRSEPTDNGPAVREHPGPGIGE